MIASSVPRNIDLAVRTRTRLRTLLYLDSARFLLLQLLGRILSIIVLLTSFSFVPSNIMNHASFRETGCAEEDRAIDAVLVDLAGFTGW